jgi:circadian clock protein KaiB
MQASQSRSDVRVKPPATFQFRLYIAGDALNSKLALNNLSAICRSRLPGCYAIDVVDVFSDPKRALADGIFLTPTLIKLSPAPIRKIVGTLSNTSIVLIALGLDTAEE